MRAPASPDIRRVGIEDCFIVRLPELGKRFNNLWIGLIAICLKGTDHHPEAAVRHDRALQRSVSLEAYDHFILTIDITGSVGSYGAWNLGNIEYPFPSLLDKQFVQAVPDSSSAFG